MRLKILIELINFGDCCRSRKCRPKVEKIISFLVEYIKNLLEPKATLNKTLAFNIIARIYKRKWTGHKISLVRKFYYRVCFPVLKWCTKQMEFENVKYWVFSKKMELINGMHKMLFSTLVSQIAYCETESSCIMKFFVQLLLSLYKSLYKKTI